MNWDEKYSGWGHKKVRQKADERGNYTANNVTYDKINQLLSVISKKLSQIAEQCNALRIEHTQRE